MEKLTLTDLIQAEHYTNAMAHEIELMIPDTSGNVLHKLNRAFANARAQNLKLQIEIAKRLSDATGIADELN